MSNIFRPTLSLFVILAFTCSVPSSAVFGADHMDSPSFPTTVWSLSPSQTFRVCVIFVADTSDKAKKQSLYFPETMLQSGEIVLQAAELSVPDGEFRCVNILYDDLASAFRDAGEPPDPTGTLTFRFNLLSDAKDESGTSIVTLINADTASGKIETYQGWTGWSKFYRSL